MNEAREVAESEVRSAMDAMRLLEQHYLRVQHHLVLLMTAVMSGKPNETAAALQTTRAAIAALKYSAKEIIL